jgi:prepilin-type N-terminal cleavage/methylation domain-containing protein
MMRALPSPRRRGFTWIELLVVIAIIAVLIGLLIPATRRVREASARTMCQNNLKQIVLGLHNYAGACSYLPPGTVVNPSLVPQDRLSWVVPLLPYLEQQSLYERIDRKSGWESEGNRAPGSTTLYPLLCPAYPKPEKSAEWPRVTTYIGIAGVGPEAAALAPDDPRCGVFGCDRCIGLKDVADGTSSTVAIVESYKDNGPWAAGGAATVRGLDPARQPYIAEGGPFGTTHRNPTTWQMSRLPTLATAAMLDGSVRAFSTSMNPHTFEALATIAGKDTPGPDF